MLWFKRRQEHKAEIVADAAQSTIEVVELKTKTRQSAAQTKKDIDRLNRLLKANGITLRIHIATKDHHA